MSSDGPFEWLAGGLFFGKAKGGVESIDSSKDALTLLRGTCQCLDQIIGQQESHSSTASSSIEKPTDDDTHFTLLAARLARLRFLLYDERRIVPAESDRRSTPTVTGICVQALTKDELQDLIPRLLENLGILHFESRKDVAAIFNYLLVSGLDGSDAELYQPPMHLFRDYVASRFDRIMTIIVNGHETAKNQAADVGLHFGSMYRVFLRHPTLYSAIVGSTDSAQRYVFPFMDTFVHLPNFDVASDSMETLRLVLTAGGDKIPEHVQPEMAELAADFLTRDYVEIWEARFNPKLLAESANYMTRRVALQILSTVLLTRSNYAVMIQFVASRTNLILVMKLLRDTSPHITLDAFHVFKVFVANPSKPPEVVQILRDNKVKLCKYLATLHQEKESSDAQFRDEKALIISTIEAI
jgi:calcium binding protein 39